MGQKEEVAQLLTRVDILEPLSKEEIRWLALMLPVVRYEPGQFFYTPGYRSKSMFLLLEGQARIYQIVGGQELTLIVLAAGTIFAETSLSSQRYEQTYAQAMQPSRVCLMRYIRLRDLMINKPEVGLKMAEVLSERQVIYQRRMAEISTKGVPARLARLALRLIEESEDVVTPEGYKLPTRYTLQHLATMVGTQRAAVIQALGYLQQEGAVELKNRHIYVRDIETLKRVAERIAG